MSESIVAFTVDESVQYGTDHSPTPYTGTKRCELYGIFTEYCINRAELNDCEDVEIEMPRCV